MEFLGRIQTRASAPLNDATRIGFNTRTDALEYLTFFRFF